VSGYIIISAIAVGLSSLAYCLPDVVAMLRARREDIPAVMKARARRDKHPREGNARTRRAPEGPQVSLVRQRHFVTYGPRSVVSRRW
jgi:hypothetical protein